MYEDTYTDADGIERCGECDEPVQSGSCICDCEYCGDLLVECSCDEGRAQRA